MNVYGRVEVQFQLLLTSTLEEGECLASHYGHLAYGIPIEQKLYGPVFIKNISCSRRNVKPKWPKVWVLHDMDKEEDRNFEVWKFMS
jgi:hypothetical protein